MRIRHSVGFACDIMNKSSSVENGLLPGLECRKNESWICDLAHRATRIRKDYHRKASSGETKGKENHNGTSGIRPAPQDFNP